MILILRFISISERWEDSDDDYEYDEEVSMKARDDGDRWAWSQCFRMSPYHVSSICRCDARPKSEYL